MTTDREILIWLHDRLVHVHGESELFDYMHRLRKIIYHTDHRKVSDGPSANDMDELKEKLGIKK